MMAQYQYDMSAADIHTLYWLASLLEWELYFPLKMTLTLQQYFAFLTYNRSSIYKLQAAKSVA